MSVYVYKLYISFLHTLSVLREIVHEFAILSIFKLVLKRLLSQQNINLEQLV